MKKKRLMALLLALTCWLTGCAKKETKKPIIVSSDFTLENSNDFEVEEPTILTEIPTVAPTEVPTPAVTVNPATQIPVNEEKISNLISSNEIKVVNKNNVHMRLDTSTDSLHLGYVNAGDKCTAIAEYKDWSLVMVGNTICYIKSEFLNTDSYYASSYNLTEELDIVYATTGVNFRLSPDINDYNKIMLIPKNEEIEVFGKTDNGWYLAKYNGKIGYVSAEYTISLKERVQRTYPEIDELKVQKIVGLTANTSLLREPNPSYGIVKNLEVYQPIEILGYKEGYYFAKAGESVGYVLKSDTCTLSNSTADVNLSNKRLKLYVSNDVIFNLKIAVGGNSTPTPTGIFDVSKVIDHECHLIGPNADGSEYDVVVPWFVKLDTSKVGREGIGFHPGKDGNSHGCIRILEDVNLIPYCSSGMDVCIH